MKYTLTVKDEMITPKAEGFFKPTSFEPKLVLTNKINVELVDLGDMRKNNDNKINYLAKIKKLDKKFVFEREFINKTLINGVLVSTVNFNSLNVDIYFEYQEKEAKDREYFFWNNKERTLTLVNIDEVKNNLN